MDQFVAHMESILTVPHLKLQVETKLPLFIRQGLEVLLDTQSPGHDNYPYHVACQLLMILQDALHPSAFGNNRKL